MNNRWIKAIRRVGFGPLAILVFAFSASAESYYEIVNLGALPGQTGSFANHTNSSGTVVGSSGSRASAQSISKQGAIVSR